MGYPQYGPDGRNHYQQPPYGPPFPPGQPPMPQMPPAPYQQPVPYGYGPPMHGRIVSKQKIGAAGNTVHLILTIVSCGAWLPIWGLIWLLTRKKTVTRY